MSVAQPSRFRWSVPAYEQAAEAGVFGADARTELVDGEVILVTAMLPPHARAVRALRSLLYAALGDADVTIGSQEPVVLSERDEPEPDAWVARGRDDTRSGHPRADELLVVFEVAQASLVGDLARKVPRYAAAGVPRVVVLDVNAGRLLDHSDPLGGEARYATVRATSGDEPVLLEIAGRTLVVSATALTVRP